MSWKCGNQQTDRLSAVCANPSSIDARLCSTFWWLTMTPFGFAVEPDVYCRYATASARRLGSRQPSIEPSSTTSVASHRHGSPLDVTYASASIDAIADDVVSPKVACESARILCTRGLSRFDRGRCAGIATTP